MNMTTKLVVETRSGTCAKLAHVHEQRELTYEQLQCTLKKSVSNAYKSVSNVSSSDDDEFTLVIRKQGTL